MKNLKKLTCLFILFFACNFTLSAQNVGIGTNNPQAKLDVYGTISLNDNQLRLRGGSDGNHWLGYQSGGGFDGAKLYGNATIALQTSTLEVVLKDGKLGVGTASPTRGRLHVSGNASYGSSGGNYFDQSFGNGAGTNDYGPFTFNVGIYCESDLVVAGKIAAESDARVKNIQGISNGNEDLQTLMAIQITDYTHKDGVRFGGQSFKKVIAQQIEEVYPIAVSKMSNFIPNIYQTAQAHNGVINIKTDAVAGDKLKLITGTGTQSVVTVIENDGIQVSVDNNITGEVFVYGKEVNDFRGVDYDALAMLNISATQEQQRLIEQLQQENAVLKNQVGVLNAQALKTAELEDQLTAIRAALESNGIPIDVQASTK